MKYEFPHITHISDVLPHIEGKDEFIVADKGDYKVINYAVVTEDTFPPMHTAGGSAKMRAERIKEKAILRECRGLIFDAEGNLISRRLHKFFNVNERDETRFEKIDFTQKHRFLEKLDGSMVTPILIGEHLRWGTKMGITDTSMNAEVFISNNKKYEDFSMMIINDGYTPIFEWLSRKNRIVVDYKEENLVLLAIRVNDTGEYLNYDLMQSLAFAYDIPVVNSYPVENAESAIEEISKWEDSEGVVIRFEDGHMVKLKSEWYVLRHKSKDAISREKSVLDYVVNDKVDDILPYLTIEDQNRLIKFRDEFFKNVKISEEKYRETFDGISKRYSRKDWAKENSKNPDAKMIFELWDGRHAHDVVMNFISRNINRNDKIDKTRWIWGGLKWDYDFEDN